jgi:protein-S-isoprenylcysteine O-methyltransferase Ste14
MELASMTPPEQSSPQTRTRGVLAILGTVVFLVLAPGFFVVLMPYWISGWQFQPAFLGFPSFRVIGAVLITASAPVLLESFARFALEGLGTPAPVFPTQHLVVKGFYRYARNPMYLAVVSMVIGQALLLGNLRVLAYGLFAFLITHVFVLSYEEPKLRETFGAEYETYCAHVPRWIPRIAPWRNQTQPTA